MAEIWEKLTSPELVFGLGVRFFGVFAVLIVVMIGIWLSGCFFVRLEGASRKGRQSPDDDVEDAEETETAGTEEGVTDEVAAVIALALSRQGRVNDQRVVQHHRPMNTENSWKLQGRQRAVSRSRSMATIRARRRR